jgi:hypothetical protein
MRFVVPAAFAAVALVNPAYTQSDLEAGFAGALRGCEEWVLNPASWANGLAPFVAKVGLGDKMGLVEHVDPAVLPPPILRVANRYWRINSTNGAGYVLIVSDQLPMCHITGGGDTDLQPVVSSVLTSSAFIDQWKLIKEGSTGDVVTSEFQSVEEPKFTIVISRAKKPGSRLDQVQVVATAMFSTSK